MNPLHAHSLFAVGLLALIFGAASAEERPLPEGFCEWKVTDFEIKESICDLNGDAERGRVIVLDSHLGNCLACHIMPIPEEEFQGTVGPPLMGVGIRYSEGAIRLRVVDEQQINPMTIMPGFYADPRKANRVADDYFGKTFLTAQQVEDVVAYLRTLK